MDVKTTIPVTEARRRFFEINDEVQIPGKHYTFTEKGRPKSVLISAEEYESLIETIEVMIDFPDLKKDIEEVERDYKSGNYKNFITLDELLKEEGLVVIKKGKKHVVRSTSRTSREKRVQKTTKKK
ncbi:MAG: type II toxin-antitoxin system Phd/YefM family antitoxin [Candidatus Moraniibacteriota bacterium]